MDPDADDPRGSLFTATMSRSFAFSSKGSVLPADKTSKIPDL